MPNASPELDLQAVRESEFSPSPTADAESEPSPTLVSTAQDSVITALKSPDISVSRANPALKSTPQVESEPPTTPDLQLQEVRSRCVKRFVQQHWKTGLACVASMLLGMVVDVMVSDSSKSEAVVAEAPAKVVYTAANAHRIEPIIPVVPFEGLDQNVVELGRRLFHDSALSGNGKLSCGSCHDLSLGGADGQKTARGIGNQPGTRNTPTVFNSAFNFAQNWDGRAETLEQQLDEHLSETGEMQSDWSRVIKVLKHDPLYNRTFQLHLGGEPTEDLVRVALATFERSLVTVDSKFDQWLRGNDQALNSDEIAGYYLFKQYNCISCHQGTGVGGTMLQPLAGMQKYFDAVASDGQVDLGRFAVTQPERDRNVFRVPALRNVELTAPYFHDGSAPTLAAAVQSMLEHQLGLKPNQVEVDRIVAFLKTLTGKPLAE